MLDAAQPDELYLFDITYEYFKFDIFSKEEASKICRKEGDSSALLSEMPDEYFDVIYVDGDHSYSGCKKDLDAATDKLKPGGWLIANDYMAWSHLQCVAYGVMRAVNEFANKNRWPIRHLALHKDGYFDVSLQKPF